MTTDPSRPAPRAGAKELVDELQEALERAAELLQNLRVSQPQSAPPRAEDAGSQRMQQLKQRLAHAEADLHEISERLVEAEQQRGRLMNLYVATYQLHATMDLDEVEATIAEIVRDLLGAESFALLLREGETLNCEVALAEGVVEADSLFAGPRYSGGDPMVDRTLDDGVLRMEPEEGSAALAVVPLMVQGMTVGAIVLLKLFDHKPALTAEDRDLFDVLAAHAASALFAARVYSTTDRKLRTLESLVKLVRKG